MIQKIKDEHAGGLEQASPWLLALRQQFQNHKPEVLIDWEAERIRFIVFRTQDSLWIQAQYPGGGSVAFRAAYCPGVELSLDNPEESSNGAVFHLHSAIGKLRVQIQLPIANRAFVRWTTSLTPDFNLSMPFWPRDLYLLDEKNNPLEVEGIVHASQHGPATAAQYISLTKPESGVLLYLQNMTALNDYCEKTHTSLAYCVGGAWPELGMSLPVNPNNPLPAEEEVVISDGIAALSAHVPRTKGESARLYLDLMAEIYMLLPRPETEFHNWPDRSEACYQSIRLSPQCNVTIDECRYMVPYVGAIEKPPESMVQLAVLVPLVEYSNWSGKELELVNELMDSVKQFYDPDLHMLLRFLPGVEFPDGKMEPQEHHDVMDSWYLYHPLLNLVRLAEKGFDGARELFFNSLEYGIRVAQKFNYQWPVFYNIKTLEILREETAPGDGGETDVGCIYILVMMHAYELSKDRRYVEEAEKAASAMLEQGFNLLYETNITAFGMTGFWLLYQETHNPLYLDMCYVCLAGIVQNIWLWECQFGYAKNYKTFMGALPLRDAAYLASYEELEILAAFNEFLIRGEKEIPRSAVLLMSEFIRYALDTAWYDFPVELPADMISEQVKTGRIDRNLIVPLEDLYEGWQKAGQTGQEVYGTSSAFVYSYRFYLYEDDIPFDVFCDYPYGKVEFDREKQTLCLPLVGDARLKCKIRLIPRKSSAIPLASLNIRVSQEENGHDLEGSITDTGHLDYKATGNSKIWIKWQEDGIGNR